MIMTCRLLLCLVLLALAAAREYAADFKFGDSLTDTGNLCVDGIPDYLAMARLPYGVTYFGYPTGRVSDGRVIVDFIAQELGMPLLPPSKVKNAMFHRGANFATTGATAMDIWSSGSLHAQIKWFRDLEPKICSSPQEWRDLFRRSLFIVGEFSGNNYGLMLFAFRPLLEVHDLIPHIVNTIARGVEELIAEGAVDLVVPDMMPVGCFPLYLSMFPKPAPEMYGARSRCARDLNTLAWAHNAALERRGLLVFSP